MKRRALVLSDEAARHPFRRTLPAHIRASGAVAQVPVRRSGWRLSWGDWRDFASAYCACFAATWVFMA